MKEVSEKLFKVGERVFDIRFGWGTVISTTRRGEYKVEVKFDGGKTDLYAVGGFYVNTDPIPMLSYKEYTLQGFSQEKPKPNIAVGEVIFVNEYGVWIPKRFYKWEGKYAVCFCNGIHLAHQINLNEKSSNFSELPTVKYEEYSKEDPYKEFFELGS